MRKVTIVLFLTSAFAVGGEGAWVDFESGRKAFERGEFAKAESLMKAAVATDARVQDAHYYLGVMAKRRGEKSAAAELFA
jgi:Tfp pilus assembly protein PilF